MSGQMAQAFAHNFLGHSPRWYKACVIVFLILNALAFFTLGPVVAGWMLVLEFIFTLAMALKCYPLMPGGLLVLQAVALGMTTPKALYDELVHNFPVILLLMFMVAGIYFMKDLLLFLFSRLLGCAVQGGIGLDVLLPLGVPVGIPRCADRDGGDYQRRGGFLCGVPPRGLGQ
jgi:NhaB family Na+:H+ antiporter